MIMYSFTIRLRKIQNNSLHLHRMFSWVPSVGGVRNVLQYYINRIDLLQYTEDKGDLFYHYDVETKMANSYTEGSYRSATYEVTAIIELTNEKGDLVSGHRSVICRVSFDGNDVLMDNLVSLIHRVERFVNEVVKHLSQ